MGELEIFAVRIKELRLSLNMTQKEFSEYVDIKQQTLSGYERGIMKPPLDIARGIAEKCNISIDWLCGLTEKKSYSEKLETYSDVIKFLDQIEQTKIGMKIVSVPNPDNTSFPCIENLPVIAFNSMEMINFLMDYEQILTMRNNLVINNRLYRLWLKDTLDEHSKKIQSNEIVDHLFKQEIERNEKI